MLNILIALFNQAYSVVTGPLTVLSIRIIQLVYPPLPPQKKNAPRHLCRSGSLLIVDNAVDEFLALFSGKTLEFIRAPDENSFCPPLNLIEIFLLLPCQPFLSKEHYQRLNQIVMKMVYAPVLTLIAVYEAKYFSLESPFFDHDLLISLPC